jgi:hypothetical protein
VAAEPRVVLVLSVTLGTLHGTFTFPDARILLKEEGPVNRQARALNCAQSAPKKCQKYQNVSRNIEIHRNLGAQKKRPIAGELHYFLCLRFSAASYTR